MAQSPRAEDVWEGTCSMTSIIIPVHNEERGLARLLPLLCADDSSSATYEILVVCNGCTDGSAALARQFEPAVIVFDLPEPSKAAALQWGNSRASSFPRVYMDSDIEINADSVRSLERSLSRPGILASAPSRIIDRAGVSLLANWYYDVWELLPQCREGLFGRGVIAVSEAGCERVRHLPPVIADDLAVSEAFSPAERAVDESATVVVYPARTWRALVRRRVRVLSGTRQSQQMGLAGGSPQMSAKSLLVIAQQRPAIVHKLVLFAITALSVRGYFALAPKRNYEARWTRDESSRRAD
jgi:glycosyltransferase involved in cell wall biosynthesis